jgi:hypothetical protein
MPLFPIHTYEPRGRFGWWSVDGWCIEVGGLARALPADLGADLGGGLRYSEAEDWLFAAFDETKGGTHRYYEPGAGLRRSDGGFGLDSIGVAVVVDADLDTGWSVAWEQDAPYAHGARHFWRVLAIPRAGGLGVWPGSDLEVTLPWWHNHLYREWPPLPRGRPPLVP